MLPNRKRGFLILESLIALLIFGIISSFFWQGWQNLNSHSLAMLKRLSRERAATNAHLLYSRGLAEKLPVKVHEAFSLVSLVQEEDGIDAQIITMHLQDSNGASFTREVKTR
jgi:type II secretory pathway component PulJ